MSGAERSCWRYGGKSLRAACFLLADTRECTTQAQSRRLNDSTRLLQITLCRVPSSFYTFCKLVYRHELSAHVPRCNEPGKAHEVSGLVHEPTLPYGEGGGACDLTSPPSLSEVMKPTRPPSDTPSSRLADSGWRQRALGFGCNIPHLILQ